MYLYIQGSNCFLLIFIEICRRLWVKKLWFQYPLRILLFWNPEKFYKVSQYLGSQYLVSQSLVSQYLKNLCKSLYFGEMADSGPDFDMSGCTIILSCCCAVMTYYLQFFCNSTSSCCRTPSPLEITYHAQQLSKPSHITG